MYSRGGTEGDFCFIYSAGIMLTQSYTLHVDFPYLVGWSTVTHLYSVVGVSARFYSNYIFLSVNHPTSPYSVLLPHFGRFFTNIHTFNKCWLHRMLYAPHFSVVFFGLVLFCHE